MVSVKKKRQLDSWLNRAKKIEQGTEKSFTVEGKVYDSAFACYEEAYKVDPDNNELCLKLYNLWADSDRPITDWRRHVARGRFRTRTGRLFEVASTRFIRGLASRLVRLALTDHNLRNCKFHHEMYCLGCDDNAFKMSYRTILTASTRTADEYMLYLMVCEYDEEVVGKALDVDSKLKTDWQFWQAMSLIAPDASKKDASSNLRLKEMLQAAALVSPSGVIVTPSIACMSICLQLQHEGRIVDPNHVAQMVLYLLKSNICPYFALVPAAKKLALATHGVAVKERRNNVPSQRGSLLVSGVLHPLREFLRGDYCYVGDFYNIEHTYIPLHRKEIGPNREATLDVLAAWLRGASSTNYEPSLELVLEEYLSLRYCHGDRPMEPVRLEVLSDVDSKAVEESRKLALSGSPSWHQAFFLWSADGVLTGDRSPDEITVIASMKYWEDSHELDFTHSDLSIAMLDRYYRKEMQLPGEGINGYVGACGRSLEAFIAGAFAQMCLEMSCWQCLVCHLHHLGKANSSVMQHTVWSG